MSFGFVTAAYIIAAILFIMSLAGLSKHETAKAGCWYGIVGMAIALVATIFGPQSHGTIWIFNRNGNRWIHRGEKSPKSRNDRNA